MAMFGLGVPELLIVLGLAVLIFGGSKLPELGKGLGEGIASFKRGLRAVGDDRLAERSSREGAAGVAREPLATRRDGDAEG